MRFQVSHAIPKLLSAFAPASADRQVGGDLPAGARNAVQTGGFILLFAQLCGEPIHLRFEPVCIQRTGRRLIIVRYALFRYTR